MKVSKLFFILFFIKFAIASDIKELPKEFLKTFDNYVSYATKEDIKKLYDMELSYMRFLHSYDEFKELTQRYEKPLKITIAEVKSLKDDEILITIDKVIKKANSKETESVYLQQKWFKVDGKYYILSNYSILPE